MTEGGEIIPLFLVSTLSNLQSFHTFHTSFINIHDFHTSIINFQYFHTFHTFFYNKQGRLNVCYCLCVLNNQTPAHWKQRTLSKEVNIWNPIARALEHNAFQCVRLSKESFWKNSGRRFCFKERRPKNGKAWRHLLLSVGPHAPPLMALTSVFHFKKTERQARRPPPHNFLDAFPNFTTKPLTKSFLWISFGHLKTNFTLNVFADLKRLLIFESIHLLIILW